MSNPTISEIANRPEIQRVFKNWEKRELKQELTQANAKLVEQQNTITSLRAELERKDAALREAIDYITDDAAWSTGPVENNTMEVVDALYAALSAQKEGEA